MSARLPFLTLVIKAQSLPDSVILPPTTCGSRGMIALAPQHKVSLNSTLLHTTLTLFGIVYKDVAFTAYRRRFIFLCCWCLDLTARYKSTIKALQGGRVSGKSPSLPFKQMSRAVLCSPGTHSGAALWSCNSAGPWATAVLYGPELLYSLTLLSLHWHHTNKIPS